MVSKLGYRVRVSGEVNVHRLAVVALVVNRWLRQTVFSPVLIYALTASSDHSQSHCVLFFLFRYGGDQR